VGFECLAIQRETKSWELLRAWSKFTQRKRKETGLPAGVLITSMKCVQKRESKGQEPTGGEHSQAPPQESRNDGSNVRRCLKGENCEINQSR